MRHMDGKLHAKNGDDAKRIITGLTRKQKRKKAEGDLKIQGAVERLETLEQELKKVKTELATVSSQYRKLWARKMEQEGTNAKGK